MQAMILPRPRPVALMAKVRNVMDIILHLGAHRTASTSFQHYLRQNAARLAEDGTGVWGPLRTRDGLLTGVLPTSGPASATKQFDRARGRIAVNLEKARKRGLKRLVVSDENMIGAPRQNLRNTHLYGSIGERMARFVHAFGGQINRIALSIRAQDSYWASVMAFAVQRGHAVPNTATLDRLVTTNRHWRDVINDLACSAAGAEIQVHTYEALGGRPEQKLRWMTGQDGTPLNHAREWKNQGPNLTQLRGALIDRGQDPALLPDGEGRWRPFDASQKCALREIYADDLYWLRAGADGLATLYEENGPVRAETQSPAEPMTRGQDHGKDDRRLA